MRLGRLIWWPPQRLSCWWKLDRFEGEDENCNPTMAWVLPPFGLFAVIRTPGKVRTTPCQACRPYHEDLGWL